MWRKSVYSCFPLLGVCDTSLRNVLPQDFDAYSKGTGMKNQIVQSKEGMYWIYYDLGVIDNYL